MQKQNIKKDRKIEKIPTPFSLKQINRFFSVVDNPKMALICLLSLRTGMRRNEVLSTKISEIEWSLMRINKPITKNGVPRVYFLDKRMISILRKWVMLLGDTDYLFPSNVHDKGRMMNEGFYSEFKKYLIRANLWTTDERIKGNRKRHIFTFHSLRTTFCSFLVNAGVSPWITKELMGHSKISTTEKHYVYLGSITLRQELEKVFGRGNKGVKAIHNEIAHDQREIIPAVSFSTADISEPQRNPLHTLQIKLANGEVSLEEFEKKSEAIMKVQNKNNPMNYIG